MPQDNTPIRTRTLPPIALAGRFLFLSPAGGDADQPAWAKAAKWLPVWGLGIGIVYAVVFRLTWRAFGEYQGIRWLPVAAVLAFDLLLCGYRMVAGVASLASLDRDRDGGAPPRLRGLLFILLIVLTKFSLLVSLPVGVWQSPPGDNWGWSGTLSRLGLLYPTAVYRPLILAPLWGRWAISLAVAIGRTAPGSSHRLERIGAGSSMTSIVAAWLGCAVLTAVYCSGTGEHLARGVVLAVASLVIAYLTSFILALRSGGQTEATTGTVGLVTEMAFLIFYVGASNAIYWY